MQLRQVIFKDYKAFGTAKDADGRHRLEFAPLTLIFGKNNSGKSALARLPRLILGSVAAANPELIELSVGGLRYGDRFLDLVHGGAFFTRPVFGLIASHEGEILDFESELYAPGALSMDDPPLLWSHEMRHPEVRQVIDPNREPERPRFAGLLPDDARWQGWRTAAARWLGEMIHLGPMRARAASSYTATSVRGFSRTGAETPHWLRADGDLEDAVSAWTHEYMDGWRVSVVRAGDGFHLEASRSRDLRTNIACCGEGIHQVLPVVTHQLWRRRHGAEGFFDVVEQPELHLHAAAQAPLADLFIDTATHARGTVVVETHSQPLLLRVQRRVAEGRISPEQVAIYFVDAQEGGSVLKRVHLDEGGEADWWPEGVFEENFEEVAAMRRAQRKREPRSDAL